MGHTEELLTKKSFIRSRALALLDEFSRPRIAERLAGGGQPDAPLLAELVEPLDSLLLAFSNFRVLAYPFGLRSEWKVDQEEFFHRESVGAFVVQLRPEMIAAHIIGPRTSRPKAVSGLTLAWNGWKDALAGWPRKGNYFDRQQAVGLVYASIAPRPADAKSAFHSAAFQLGEATGERIDADEFFWEFMSASKVGQSMRYLVRRPDGWKYEPIQLAGIVQREAEKGRKKDLAIVAPEDLKSRPAAEANSEELGILETIQSYRAARLAQTRSAAERAVLDNLEGLLTGEITETDVSRRTAADQSNISKALEKARGDLRRLAQ